MAEIATPQIDLSVSGNTWVKVADYSGLDPDLPAIVRVANTGSADVEVLIPELYGVFDATPSESLKGGRISAGESREFTYRSAEGKARGLIPRVYARSSSSTIDIEVVGR